MNFLDLVILCAIGFFTIKGLFRGFIHEVLGLLGLLVALIFATKYMDQAGTWVAKVLDISSGLSSILGFLLVFFGIVMVSQLLIHLFQRLVRYAQLGWLEKISGGVVGLLKGTTIVSLAFLFVTMLPYGTELIPGRKDSKLYKPLLAFAPDVFDTITKLMPESKSFYSEFQESLENLPNLEAQEMRERYLKSMQDDNLSPQDHSEKDEKSR